MFNRVNLVKGTIFKAKLPVFYGSFKNPKFSHNVDITARVVKESYSERGQHTFTFEVLETTDSAEFAVGKKYRKKGRNLYPNIVEVVAQPDDYDAIAAEKRQRAIAVQDAKESRKAIIEKMVEEYVAAGMSYSDACEHAMQMM